MEFGLYAHKKGGLVPTWKHRWFQCNPADKIIKYYSNRSDTQSNAKSKGTIHVARITLQKNGCLIRDEKEDRTYVIKQFDLESDVQKLLDSFGSNLMKPAPSPVPAPASAPVANEKALTQEKTYQEAKLLSKRIEKQKQMQQLGEKKLRELVDKECLQSVDEGRLRSVLLAFQNPNLSSQADPILLLDMKSRGFMQLSRRFPTGCA